MVISKKIHTSLPRNECNLPETIIFYINNSQRKLVDPYDSCTVPREIIIDSPAWPIYRSNKKRANKQVFWLSSGMYSFIARSVGRVFPVVGSYGVHTLAKLARSQPTVVGRPSSTAYSTLLHYHEQPLAWHFYGDLFFVVWHFELRFDPMTSLHWPVNSVPLHQRGAVHDHILLANFIHNS